MASHPATRSHSNPAFGRPSSIAPVAPRVATPEPAHLPGILWRRRKPIFAIIACLMLLTLLVLNLVTMQYRAEALLMIEKHGTSRANQGLVDAGIPLDNGAIASEIEIIQSRSLAEKVIDHLQLAENPVFNIALRPHGALEQLKPQHLFAQGGWLETPGRYLASPRAQSDDGTQRARIIATFLQGLTVARKGDSRAIALSYTSPDPETSTIVVNTLAELYMLEQIERNRDTARANRQRLAEQLKELRRRALESELAVEQYRQNVVLAGQLETDPLAPELSRKLREQKVKLQALEDEATADRQVLQTFLAQTKASLAQQQLETFQPHARLISRGNIPLRPSFPQPVPILALMLLISTLGAVLLVLIDESLDRGFRDCEDMEAQSGVRMLAYLPNTRRRWLRSKSISDAKTAFAEAVRTLYTSLLIASSGQAPKTVLITSTESAEGKSTLAVCLALTRAVAGDKVLIIDLNLRKPQLHHMFGIQRSPGLVELLAGETAIETAIQTNHASGADVLTAGGVCMTPADIMMGDNLETLLEILRARYDLVILDSAPFRSYPDTRVLLDKADAVVVVVRWARTKRRLVRRTLTQIMNSGAQSTSVALNRVDVKSYAKNGYRTAGYCAGR